MNSEEIRTKASELAALYVAKANGRTLQFLTDVWADYEHDAGPSMQSDLTRWRVKPEPRRMWECSDDIGSFGKTESEDLAKKWKNTGFSVTEWVEVIPE